MKKKMIIALFTLFIVASCRKEESSHVIDYEGQYISLVSKEKTIWVLPFDCFFTITPYSPLDEKMGVKERNAILNGGRVLDNHTIEQLDCWPIFDLPQSLDIYKGFIDSVKNNDSVDINLLSYPKNGIYINELIKRGFIVSFADDEGMFYSRKKGK